MSSVHSKSSGQDASFLSSCSISACVPALASKKSFLSLRSRHLKHAASYNSFSKGGCQPSRQLKLKLSTPSLPSFGHRSHRRKAVRSLVPPKSAQKTIAPFPGPRRTSTTVAPSRPLLKIRRNRATIHTPASLSRQTSSPDRFIPRRRSSNGLLRSFTLNKSLERLSAAERHSRNNAANHNPFSVSRASASQRRTHNETRIRLLQATPRDPSRRGPLRTRTASSSGNRNSTGSGAAQLGPVPAIPDGRGRLFRSGTNAPLLYANFFPQEPPKYVRSRYENRIAAALNVDRSARTLRVSLPEVQSNIDDNKPRHFLAERWWDAGRWAPVSPNSNSHFLLDAPQMRDDFYCSILAFCVTTRTLAVGLGNRVYLWSEEHGVTPLRRQVDEERSCYIGSLSFSAGSAGQSILAVGRSNGVLSLWGFNEDDDRFVCGHPHGITCVSFKPVAAFQRSRVSGVTVLTEELLVGDEKGCVFYYSVEWETASTEHEGGGTMNLLAKIDIHAQQVCGIAWSPDGNLFATGANDNLCLLFDTADMFDRVAPHRRRWPVGALHQQARTHVRGWPPGLHIPSMLMGSNQIDQAGVRLDVLDSGQPIRASLGSSRSQAVRTNNGIPVLVPGCESQRWIHTAAIKAIAFCPWQKGLVAVGGGSNDRGIHFYHVWSGACLATINVLAQVTSLIWSKTRREIVATLGFCQPDHPFRIAVYSWPSCEQILAIPWQSETRALYAIPYPGGPNDPKVSRSGEGEPWWKRTAEEGSIVVASSDESVKFHEVWSERARSARLERGGLGWSDILEGLEGAEKDGEVIR